MEDKQIPRFKFQKIYARMHFIMEESRPKNSLKFCPLCGSTKIETLGGGRKWKCPDCRMELYNNVAAAVGVLMTDIDGNLLMEKRGKEPRKGFFALPGGFVDPDETVEEAAKRECMEEIGIVPENLVYLCSYPNSYDYGEFTYRTCDIFFTASLPRNFEVRPQKTEVAGFQMVKIETSDDIENCPLAFGSAKKALAKWIETRRKK